MKLLIAFVFVALITACGGGQSTDSVVHIPMPSRLASPVSGDTEIALHLYQALYGKAPSLTQINAFKAQIAANGAGAWANATAANLNNLSNTAFAQLVLNNISITPTSLTSTAAFGTSKQAYEGLLAGFVDYLNLVGTGNRGIVAAQLAKIISGLEGDAQFGVYGQAAVLFNRQMEANFAYASDPTRTSDSIVVYPYFETPPSPG